MLNILFVVAREFFEAALIISIIFAYLKKQEMIDRGRSYLLGGIGIGVVLSGAIALLLYNLSDWLEGRGLVYFEACLFLASALLMTQMVFWMKRFGKRMKNQIESELEDSFGKSGLWGIVLVTALGVGREGAEIATYLYSLSHSQVYSASVLALTCALGVICALALFMGLTRGMSRLNMRNFFALTSVFLFLTASSLLVEVVVRLTELDVLPSLIPMVWNTNQWIPAHSWLGQTLALLLGYKPTPSLMMVLVYGFYWLLIVLTYYQPQLAIKKQLCKREYA